MLDVAQFLSFPSQTIMNQTGSPTGHQIRPQSQSAESQPLGIRKRRDHQNRNNDRHPDRDSLRVLRLHRDRTESYQWDDKPEFNKILENFEKMPKF